MTPLLGADGETYAVAQGNMLVGGLGIEGKDGSSLIVNIPTVGRVPGGGTVERLIETTFLETDNLVLNLHQGDFSVTNQVAEAINDIFGGGVAVPLDARSVRVRAPLDPSQKVSFVSMLEISKLSLSGHQPKWLLMRAPEQLLLAAMCGSHLQL